MQVFLCIETKKVHIFIYKKMCYYLLMRLKVSVFLIFFFSAAIPLSAAGIGAAGHFEAGRDAAGGFTADFEADGLPFIFEGQLLFSEGRVKSLCGEIFFIAGNINLYKALNFFYGPELGGGWDFLNEKVIISNAIFAGLNGFFLPQTEFFIQAGWCPQILLAKDAFDLNPFNFPLRAGLRFWTK